MLISVNDFGPLHFEVWGNVADWAMVLVTGLTARYLWKTLQSQQKVQSAQQEMMDIEMSRFINEIKPAFRIEVDKRELQRIGEDLFIKTAHYRLVVHNNIAINPTVEFSHGASHGEWHIANKSLEPMTKFPPGSGFGVVASFRTTIAKDDTNPISLTLNFKLTFADRKGTPYIQTCYVHFTEAEMIIKNGNPINKFDLPNLSRRKH